MSDSEQRFDDQDITLELVCPECECVMFADRNEEFRVVQCPYCGLVFDHEPGEWEEEQ